jgi:hypothetical protein
MPAKGDKEAVKIVNEYSQNIFEMFEKMDANPSMAAAAMLNTYLQVGAATGIPFDELRAATINIIDNNREMLEEICKEATSGPGIPK